MFSRVFIERPRFAMVISIVLTLAGLISVFSLPISLYPEITPPMVVVSASYPGASAEVISKTVGIPLEQEINGVENMLYMDSTSENSGSYSLSITFAIGTDPDMAQVKVQNRIQQALSKLPESVQRQGLTVKRRSSDTLGFLTAYSPNKTHDRMFLSNYVQNNIKDNLSRVNGVGEVQVHASPLSMRVWLNTDKLTALNLPASSVISAIEGQNYQPSLGSVGSMPGDGTQQMTYTLQTQGRINEVEDFQNIIVRTAEEGGIVYLKDVARVEVGVENYDVESTLDGSPSVAIAVNLLSGANALETMTALKAELQRLSQYYPEDFQIDVTYDATKYISASIDEVVYTLILTFILVIGVCYLFLQDWRATLVPSLTIPVSLFATFAVMLALGYSINMLTLFGLVLAIGLVVDDAIVVVERVLYLMETENLSPKEATIKAMEQVSSAVIATTLVLLAIFVPVGFLGGITGRIYQQFAIAISTAVFFSSVNALTLSPALCATMLKPLKPYQTGPLFWFNQVLNKSRDRYAGIVGIVGRKVSVVALLLGMLILANMFFLKISRLARFHCPGSLQTRCAGSLPPHWFDCIIHFICVKSRGKFSFLQKFVHRIFHVSSFKIELIFHQPAGEDEIHHAKHRRDGKRSRKEDQRAVVRRLAHDGVTGRAHEDADKAACIQQVFHPALSPAHQKERAHAGHAVVGPEQMAHHAGGIDTQHRAEHPGIAQEGRPEQDRQQISLKARPQGCPIIQQIAEVQLGEVRSHTEHDDEGNHAHHGAGQQPDRA